MSDTCKKCGAKPEPATGVYTVPAHTEPVKTGVLPDVGDVVEIYFGGDDWRRYAVRTLAERRSVFYGHGHPVALSLDGEGLLWRWPATASGGGSAGPPIVAITPKTPDST